MYLLCRLIDFFYNATIFKAIFNRIPQKIAYTPNNSIKSTLPSSNVANPPVVETNTLPESNTENTENNYLINQNDDITDNTNTKQLFTRLASSLPDVIPQNHIQSSSDDFSCKNSKYTHNENKNNVLKQNDKLDVRYAELLHNKNTSPLSTRSEGQGSDVRTADIQPKTILGADNYNKLNYIGNGILNQNKLESGSSKRQTYTPVTNICASNEEDSKTAKTYGLAAQKSKNIINDDDKVKKETVECANSLLPQQSMKGIPKLKISDEYIPYKDSDNNVQQDEHFMKNQQQIQQGTRDSIDLLHPHEDIPYIDDESNTQDKLQDSTKNRSSGLNLLHMKNDYNTQESSVDCVSDSMSEGYLTDSTNTSKPNHEQVDAENEVMLKNILTNATDKTKTENILFNHSNVPLAPEEIDYDEVTTKKNLYDNTNKCSSKDILFDINGKIVLQPHTVENCKNGYLPYSVIDVNCKIEQDKQYPNSISDTEKHNFNSESYDRTTSNIGVRAQDNLRRPTPKSLEKPPTGKHDTYDVPKKQTDKERTALLTSPKKCCKRKQDDNTRELPDKDNICEQGIREEDKFVGLLKILTKDNNPEGKKLIAETLTVIIYCRETLSRLFTGYFMNLLSNDLTTIENQNTIQTKLDFVDLIQTGINYILYAERDIEFYKKENFDAKELSDFLFYCDKTLQKAKNDSSIDKADLLTIIEFKEVVDNNYSTKTLVKFKELFHKVFGSYSENDRSSILLLIFSFVKFSDFYKDSIKLVYKNNLVAPPVISTKISVYCNIIYGFTLEGEYSVIYWIIDWLFYTVFNNNLNEKIKIDVDKVHPDSLLIKLLIQVFGALSNNKLIDALLSNHMFVHLLSQDLSYAFKKQIYFQIMRRQTNNFYKKLKKVKRERLPVVEYANIELCYVNFTRNSNVQKLNTAVLKSLTYFFKITEKSFKNTTQKTRSRKYNNNGEFLLC